jgi:hypothetical protein
MGARQAAALVLFRFVLTLKTANGNKRQQKAAIKKPANGGFFVVCIEKRPSQRPLLLS